MNSADLHPFLFTGYCLSFRTNVLRAIRKSNAKYKDMGKACGVNGMGFTRLLNEMDEPTDEQVEKLAEYLKEIGYEWE